MGIRGIASGIGLAIMLAGCGFSPIYATHDDKPLVNQSLSKVTIANIPDRQGQMLRNHLMDRMYFQGRPDHAEATLTVSLRSTVTDVGLQKDATTARSQINMWADYKLLSLDGKELLKGVAHSAVGYSKLDAQYGTLAAQENAFDRAIKEVGEQIVNRVSLYYAEK